MATTFNTSKLGLFIVAGLGILFAFYAGNYVAEEDYTPIAAVLGAFVGLIVIFGFGRSIYLLIPVCWGLTGKISILPLPFDVRQLMVLAASGIFIADLIFKRRNRKQRHELIDLVLILNLLYLAITFFRNPVGVAALGGGERVGGRPYIDVILGVMTYLILSREIMPFTFLIKFPKWILATAAFCAFSGAVGMFAPGVGAKLAYFYSGFGPSGAVVGDVGSAAAIVSVGDTRIEFLAYPGTVLCLYVVSLINPLQLISPRNLGALTAYISAVVMVMLSGFRDGLIGIIMTTFAAAMLRDRFVGFVKLAFAIIVIALAGIGLSLTDLKLPFTFQRTLSFLPGNWDVAAVESAKDSSEWRVKMWKEVLKSDKYIHSKIFGDGFGLPRAEFEKQALAMKGGGSVYRGEMAAQEAFMINGDFHSGPLTTVRFVGVVGLLLFIPLIFMTSWYAFTMIRKTLGTPFQFCMLFVAIPQLSNPLFFIFIFGDYRTELINQLFTIGLLKMIDASLKDYKKRNLLMPKLLS